MKIPMFREKIKERMKEIGMPMTRLGMITEINKSTLSCFLSGRSAISNANLFKILDALRLSLVPVPGFKYGYNGKDRDDSSQCLKGEMD